MSLSHVCQNALARRVSSGQVRHLCSDKHILCMEPLVLTHSLRLQAPRAHTTTRSACICRAEGASMCGPLSHRDPY
jgi:hypothetical protein